jgi:hypothetical protein
MLQSSARHRIDQSYFLQSGRKLAASLYSLYPVGFLNLHRRGGRGREEEHGRFSRSGLLHVMMLMLIFPSPPPPSLLLLYLYLTGSNTGRRLERDILFFKWRGGIGTALVFAEAISGQPFAREALEITIPSIRNGLLLAEKSQIDTKGPWCLSQGCTSHFFRTIKTTLVRGESVWNGLRNPGQRPIAISRRRAIFSSSLLSERWIR